jgi:hypothetical protein
LSGAFPVQSSHIQSGGSTGALPTQSSHIQSGGSTGALPGQSSHIRSGGSTGVIPARSSLVQSGGLSTVHSSAASGLHMESQQFPPLYEEEEEEISAPFETDKMGVSEVSLTLQTLEPVTEIGSESPATEGSTTMKELLHEMSPSKPPVVASRRHTNSFDGLFDESSSSSSHKKPAPTPVRRRAVMRPPTINHDLLRELEVSISSDSREASQQRGGTSTLRPFGGITATDSQGLDFSDSD